MKIVLWCNGSTAVFGSACPSSNLGKTTFKTGGFGFLSFFILRIMIIRGVFGKILSQSFTEAQSFSYALFGFFPQRRSCLGMEISELRQEFVYRRIERRSPNFRRTFKKYRFGRELQNLLVLGIFSERQRISGIMAYDIWIKIHQFMYC